MNICMHACRRDHKVNRWGRGSAGVAVFQMVGLGFGLFMLLCVREEGGDEHMVC